MSSVNAARRSARQRQAEARRRNISLPLTSELETIIADLARHRIAGLSGNQVATVIRVLERLEVRVALAEHAALQGVA